MFRERLENLGSSPPPAEKHVRIPLACKEDETMLRETLGDLGCSLSAVKHVRIVLSMELFMAATSKT